MKTNLYPIAVAAFTLCAAALSFGQTQTGATAVIPSFYYEVVNQPDCPLNLSIFERMASRMSAAPLTVTNNDPSTVTAFVLHVNGGPRRDRSYLVLSAGKGIASGAVRNVAVSVRTDPENSVKPVISLDYVQFADGKTWGADSLGRSADVKAFVKGYDLAMSHLKTLLAGQDDADFMKALERVGYGTYSEPVPSRHTMDFAARGYETIINGLRRMSKRADEAKDLARKLELMQPPSKGSPGLMIPLRPGSN